MTAFRKKEREGKGREGRERGREGRGGEQRKSKEK